MWFIVLTSTSVLIGSVRHDCKVESGKERKSAIIMARQRKQTAWVNICCHLCLLESRVIDASKIRRSCVEENHSG